MKLWKFLLVAISIATLPCALVAVGQAQQLNCWGLRPTRIGYTEETDNPVPGSRQVEDTLEDPSDDADTAWQCKEPLGEWEDTGSV